ncbi:hypothetical protein V6N13_048912 [Hibiscus sabdariffa]|uniref:Uncharacterized protein n=1 Tax=Hibiscus sabdariffa TaxID=183260 RepID=A0ABR2QYR3_9ROSI
MPILSVRDFRSYKEAFLSSKKHDQQKEANKQTCYCNLSKQNEFDTTAVWISEYKRAEDNAKNVWVLNPTSFPSYEKLWMSSCLVDVLKSMYNPEVVQMGLQSACPAKANRKVSRGSKQKINRGSLGVNNGGVSGGVPFSLPYRSPDLASQEKNRAEAIATRDVGEKLGVNFDAAYNVVSNVFGSS